MREHPCIEPRGIPAGAKRLHLKRHHQTVAVSYVGWTEEVNTLDNLDHRVAIDKHLEICYPAYMVGATEYYVQDYFVPNPCLRSLLDAVRITAMSYVQWEHGNLGMKELRELTDYQLRCELAKHELHSLWVKGNRLYVNLMK